MSQEAPKTFSRDTIRARTPMRCPICNDQLRDVLIRDLGGISAGTVWQLHAGKCPAHGWFQTEVVARPPREIFPVTKPFGAARRVVIDGREHFAFATVWSDLPADERRMPVDPLDERYWQTKQLG